MLRDYIGKIRASLDDSNSLIPYPIQTFYCSLKSLSQSIPSSEINHMTIERFSIIYNFLKNEIKTGGNLENRKKLVSQLSDFLLSFRKHVRNDDVAKAIVRHFDDASFLQYIQKELLKCKEIVSLYSQKKNKIHIHGNNELSYIFWISKFKSDYAVHFDIFWNTLVDFLSNFPFYEAFISESSKSKIKQIVDPDKKYYVNSANSTDLFRMFSQPQFLDLLAEETSLKQKSQAFVSQQTLTLKLRKTQQNSQIQTKIPEESFFKINGQEINIEENTIKCKFSPTIRFGSLSDSEVFIKNDYISRRQFMLIQEEEGFSLVCISPSNFTAVTYPYEILVKVGMIFRANNELIQITKNQQIFQGFSEFTTDDCGLSDQPDKTLEYLPQNKSFVLQKQIEYKYLTGNRKNQKKMLNSKNDELEFTNKSIKLNCKEGEFYLPANVQVLAKTANQVISGHLSDKIMLGSNMKIVLQGIQFVII